MAASSEVPVRAGVSGVQVHPYEGICTQRQGPAAPIALPSEWVVTARAPGSGIGLWLCSCIHWSAPALPLLPCAASVLKEKELWLNTCPAQCPTCALTTRQRNPTTNDVLPYLAP